MDDIASIRKIRPRPSLAASCGLDWTGAGCFSGPAEDVGTSFRFAGKFQVYQAICRPDHLKSLIEIDHERVLCMFLGTDG